MDVKDTFGLNLPDQVPFFGFDEPYIIGNGVIMSGGLSNGIWDYSTGYGYGGVHNFLKRERLKVYIDGSPFTIEGKMHRARHTGIFYSVQEFKKAAVCLVDFAPQNQPCSARLIAVRNTSDKDIVVHPYAEIKFPLKDNILGQSDSALHLLQAEKSWLSMSFGGCDTVARYYVNCFRSETILCGNDFTMAPGEVRYFTLYHDARICARPPESQEYKYQDARMVDLPFEHQNRRDSNGTALLQECIDEWLKWTAGGLDTSFIKDDHCRTVVEGVGIFERMLQGEDGGVMATPRVYTACYVRDAFSAMRGMLALERFEEVKKFLKFQDRVYRIRTAKGEFGVPNSSQIGGDAVIFYGFGNEENWSCESPGLYVILARDYYNATGDMELIKSIQDFMRYCIDLQLTHAEKHDWKMFFNTDETESMGSGLILRELIDFKETWWSMTSSVICLTSTEFMIKCMRLNGLGDTKECAAYRQKMEKVNEALEKNFWNEGMGIYQWFRTPKGDWPKTLIPDYHITPLYMNAPVNKEHALSSARNMAQHWNPETGYIPNQVFSENNDFCGHNMGYLLYAAAALKLPEADAIYESLVRGSSLSAYGMWCEVYYDNGVPYQAPTTYTNKMHNLRCFESGTNLEALIYYWKSK